MLFHFLLNLIPLCHHTAHYCLHFNPDWAHYLKTHPGARICKG